MFWIIVWAATLFMADIEVEYSDGLRIKLKGWWYRLFTKPKP